MRTAIFVYKPVSINISTHESSLELCGMDADTVPLLAGDNGRSLAPGIYKILSCQDVCVTGDTSAFEVVVTIQGKDNDPTPPQAATSLAPLDTVAVKAFFTELDAKVLANP